MSTYSANYCGYNLYHDSQEFSPYRFWMTLSNSLGTKISKEILDQIVLS